jgi:hypothetical protein
MFIKKIINHFLPKLHKAINQTETVIKKLHKQYSLNHKQRIPLQQAEKFQIYLITLRAPLLVQVHLRRLISMAEEAIIAKDFE